MSRRRVVFVNTFPPVVPLYDDVFPLLREQGFEPRALISSSTYRSRASDERRDESFVELWVPSSLRKHKRLAAILYWLMAPFYLLFADVGLLVFLSQPPMFYVLGAFVARLRRRAYFLHVMDLYPDLLLKNAILRFPPVRAILQWMSLYAFRGAARVVVLGRCMADILQSRGVDRSKVVIVENWPHDDIAERKGDPSSLRLHYGLAGKLVVMYAGNMGHFHTFDSILRCAKALEGQPDIVFVFVGGGVRRNEIDTMVRCSGNVILLGHQSADRFADLVALGDVHFVSLRNGYEGLMVPSKFYTILAAGRAVVYEGNPTGEVSRVVLEENCGGVVAVGDSAALKRQVELYADRRDLVALHGSAARTAYRTRFERNALARKYVELFRPFLSLEERTGARS